MRVKITSKDNPSKPMVVGMSRKTYEILQKNREVPDDFKNDFETGIIIETDDILEIEVLEDND
ncbi:hypothetical protein SAMN04487840_12418 [Streptococcus gallolyticus]|uniref:Uncharacterized protein n=1 Tax=Streptococcus gallolyticus TaxID=315405 RepID=A0A1H9VKU4_9STRE|nr:hypothetical protein SAMN04487840_12418 [Streptococcus gallolyticus]